MNSEPSYFNIFSSGILEARAENAYSSLSNCISCPHACKVNRFEEAGGVCKSGSLPIVSAYAPHFGEEPVLSGTKGAGNIFFGNCNLRCVYCQNFEISQNWEIEKQHQVTHERLAEIMIELQSKGCHNIGLVSPTHFSASILKSLNLAIAKGLSLPIIYNSNGFDSVETLKLFDDVIDIYLPDFKYGNDEYALKYSRAPNYFERAKAAIKEMFRQVGSRPVFKNGILIRGLIIRHLVLPNGLAESEKVFKFIAEELSPDVHISLMSQYYPAHRASKIELLDRKLRHSEYEKTLELMLKYGLEKGWFQHMESPDYYRPRFNENRNEPFDVTTTL